MIAKNVTTAEVSAGPLWLDKVGLLAESANGQSWEGSLRILADAIEVANNDLATAGLRVRVALSGNATPPQKPGNAQLDLWILPICLTEPAGMILISDKGYLFVSPLLAGEADSFVSATDANLDSLYDHLAGLVEALVS